jgi:hypothetical protein
VQSPGTLPPAPPRFVNRLGEAPKLDLLIFPAAVGKIRWLASRKLHRLACKVAVGAFALPEPMQQNCASGVMNTP